MRFPIQEDPQPDIIDAVFRRLIALTPGFSDAIAKQVEQEIRAEYGGQRVYVVKRKKHATPEQRQAIYADGVSNMGTQEVCDKHKIDRATLYRHLKRPTP